MSACEIPILRQDGALLVCVKPAGIPSEGENSVQTLLEAQTGGKVFPVHRLDQAAGGLMVYAKTAQAAARLSEDVRERRFQKEYFALISGGPAEDEGRLVDLLYHDRRKNKVFPVKNPRKGVREAALTYRVIERRENASLVRVALETGRTHQIRVQFASRGMPLLGDGKYGSRAKCPLALWSCRLAFAHPATGESIDHFLPPEGGIWTGWSVEGGQT